MIERPEQHTNFVDPYIQDLHENKRPYLITISSRI